MTEEECEEQIVSFAYGNLKATTNHGHGATKEQLHEIVCARKKPENSLLRHYKLSFNESRPHQGSASTCRPPTRITATSPSRSLLRACSAAFVSTT